MSQAETNSTPSEAAPRKTRFNRTFWSLNSIEMLERLAFFNLRIMAPIYIMQADNPGGLHLSATDKGFIYAWWAVFQSFLPIITGGFADRFGYKRTMFFSVCMMIIGYLMMAILRGRMFLDNAADTLAGWVEPLTNADTGSGWFANTVDGALHAIGGTFTGSGDFWGFFLGVLVLATGTAFFKPSIQGSLAHQLTKENSSVGWGIFYWVVNVGSFVSHYLPTIILVSLAMKWYGQEYPEVAWRNLFLASAFFSSFNLVIMFTFPDTPSGASKTETVWQVLKRTITNIFEIRLLCWMAIMSCFWLMMYQLWDLLPNFISDWVISTPVVEKLEWLKESNEGLYNCFVEQTARGPMIPQNILISFNAIFIIIGVVGVAWLTRKMRTLTGMFFGMIMATVGVLVAGWTQSTYVLIFGILFFSLGEMMTGPKKSEYLGLIAPPGKKGLYLGYVNIPVGVGLFFGSFIAGWIYNDYGEKANLALRYLAEKTDFGAGKNWNGDMATLEKVLGVDRSHAMEKLQEVTGWNPVEATQMLWNTYSPHYVWIPFAMIGVVAAVSLLIFGQMAKRWKDMNA